MKLLILATSLLLAGCASAGTPLDLIWPTIVPPAVESYLEHDLISIGSITTLSILRTAQQEVEVKHLLNEMEYTGASASIGFAIQATESTQEGVLAGAATLGLIGTPAAFLVGAKRKRKGDFTPDQMEVERQKVGNMQPDEFRQLPLETT